MSNLPIELTAFQRWLTSSKKMTTEEALAVCDGPDHDLYLRLWAEWEGFKDSILIIHEMPTPIERVYL